MKSYKIDQYFEFTFNTQRFDTGAATDADATPTWRVYEENNDTVIANDDCAKRDDANTTGYYYARGQCTAAAGYEAGKTYEVRVAATVNSVAGSAVVGRFTILPNTVWDSLHGGTDTLPADVTQIGGDAQSATDIKDFADTGYDPETHKVGGVVLTDTASTVSDALTAAAIATGVWQDTTAGDFTTAGSIGKSLFTSDNVPGASGGLFIAGSNAATTVNITGSITGNLSGSVGSVTGAAGSVTGAVGSVTGAVGSVTGSVGSISGITFPTNFSDLAITVTTGRVTAGTVSDKTGYALSGTQTFNLTGNITGNLSGSVGSVTGAVGSVTGSVGSVTGAVGSVTGSVGSISGVTFPTNFADLAITETTGIVTAALGNVAHGGAAATLTLSSYSNFKATGFSTHGAADVVTALGTGSTLTACITATGFSTFNPASDKVYLGNGAHGGAAASITLADYSDFQGDAGSLTAQQVWEYSTRTLSDKTGFALSSAGVTAVQSGLATSSALTAVQTHGDSTWATATSVTVSDKTGFSLASTGLNQITAFGETLPTTIELILSVLGGSTSVDGSVVTFKDEAANSLATITYTSTDGERTLAIL